MVEGQPQDSRSDADISLEKSQNEIASQSPPESSVSPPSYSVVGPHARVRTMLMWVNKLLAYDKNEYVSAISVRELREALLAFQKDVRVMGLRPEEVTAVNSRFPSSTRTSPRSQGRRQGRPNSRFYGSKN